MQEIHPDQKKTIRENLANRLRNLAGIEDISGIEIALLIRTVANFYENMEAGFRTDLEMSGPRWAILMRLWDDEKNGALFATPTDLSKFQQVKKNTISSMLKKLEEDGLVERNLDLEDKRLFRIHLTNKGKALAEKYSPQFALFQNQLASGLTIKERDNLVHLLAKLFTSLINQHPWQHQ
jgi:DNA-binding MarR family transcriptional regulator